MKQLFSIAILALTLAFASCETRPYHEIQYDPSGQQVVYVNDGYGNGYWMNYVLFNQMYNRGGYTAVHNYYTSNPTQFQNQEQTYSNYEPRSYSSPSRTTVSSSEEAPALKSYSSPSRTTTSDGTSATTKSYSSPSRTTSAPASSSSTQSYSSPSRSSNASYSSPSRSYSAPSSSSSGSYSSPSRSYSSPSSSSYSSPSRSSSSSSSSSSPSRR